MTFQCESIEKFKRFLVRLWEHDLHCSDDGNTLTGIKKTELQIADELAAQLSQQIWQGLDAAVKALSLLVPQGKEINQYAASEVTLRCADLGLQLEAGTSIIGKFVASRGDAPAAADDVLAKRCPSFDAATWSQNRCTGNACGLECLPLAL